MSKKDLQKQLKKEAVEAPTIDSVGQQDDDTEPSIFYRCNCPECGEDRLELIDTGVFERSPVFGITSEGQIGCSDTTLDGELELGLFCSDCGHRVCTDYDQAELCDDKFLIPWAKSQGEVLRTLPFHCPECGCRSLNRVEIGIEFWTEVVAVCEADSADSGPVEAVSPMRNYFNRGTFRYRCSEGHELAKDDGSPVENERDLVEWLKVLPLSIKE